MDGLPLRAECRGPDSAPKRPALRSASGLAESGSRSRPLRCDAAGSATPGSKRVIARPQRTSTAPSTAGANCFAPRPDRSGQAACGAHGPRTPRTEARRRKAGSDAPAQLLSTEFTARGSDFYPYRYLASEGFLPGYNFPALPVRAWVPREDGEFIPRPRFLALREFGPNNIVYHEGAKWEVVTFQSPPGGLGANGAARNALQHLRHLL